MYYDYRYQIVQLMLKLVEYVISLLRTILTVSFPIILLIIKRKPRKNCWKYQISHHSVVTAVLHCRFFAKQGIVHVAIILIFFLSVFNSEMTHAENSGGICRVFLPQ